MSISNALNNAYSGLSAMSRTAETVSNNVSNALTDGYSRQRVELSSVVLGGQSGGVGIESVRREIDVVATQARRRAAAGMSEISTKSEALERLAGSLGAPDDPTALANRYVELESTISVAISAPDSAALQSAMVDAAKNLANGFNVVATEANRVRVQADTDISKSVAELNRSLKGIEELNGKIREMHHSGHNIAALEDQRDSLVDRVNTIIPVRLANTGDGEIAIYSQNGGVLLNSSASVFGFARTPAISPAMTVETGGLSGLTINGKPVAVGAGFGYFNGGSLSENFQIRDVLVPKFQTRIDALSADLIVRLQDSTADPTIAAGMAGIFSDGVGAYDPSNELGISSRITVNPIVDPSLGGNAWRIRDGIGATVQGPSGGSAQLMRIADALDQIRPPTLGLGISISMNSSGFAQELTSDWAASSARSQEQVANKIGFHAALRAEELTSVGVDTDQEMQALLLVEQAYAANARVMSVLDGLMKKLLEI